MSLTTYSGLKTAIANRMDRSDLDSYMGDIVTLAELRVSRLLRNYQLESTDSFSTAASTSEYSLPSDFQRAMSLTISDGSDTYPLSFVTQQYGLSEGSATAFPVSWGISNNKLVLYPPPDAVYSVVLTYVAKPTALSDSNTTNWYLENVPDLLLYASLREASAFVRDDQATALHEAAFNAALAEVRHGDWMGRSSGGPLRTRVRGVHQ
jgi:hypothetical protein